MEKDGKEPSFEAFDAKLKKLHPGGAHGDGRNVDNPASGSGSGLGMGMQIGIELVSGLIGGLLIGLGLDYWLETRPVLMVIFIILGAAAGILNAHRYLRRLQAADENQERQ